MLHSLDPRLPRSGVRRGVTLAELLLALTIVALISTAIATLLACAGRTHAYVNNETEAMSQVENAYRRILHNVRTASALSNPNDATLHVPGTLTVTTQPDTGYASGATVTYSVSGGNLVEVDQRYGTNILVSNVATFSVQRVGTSPMQLSITITSSTVPAVSRTVIVNCRNL
jgi:prepilin-type N-terminal cleavage/methylation domain-containing protein